MSKVNRAVTSSDRKTADTIITAQGGYLYGVTLENDGTNAGSIIVYDNNAAAAAVILAKVMLPATSAILTQYVAFPNPIAYSKGIWVDVAGTGSAFIVHYSPGN